MKSIEIRESDLGKLYHLGLALNKELPEIVHMGLSLLQLKLNMSMEGKELVIYNPNEGVITGIAYGVDSE